MQEIPIKNLDQKTTEILNQSKMMSIKKILYARSVALVGASNNPMKWGFKIIDTMLKAGYTGKIYPINPKDPLIHNLPAYKSISEISDPIDMAIIVIPNQLIPSALKEAVQMKVGGVVILANGYREIGHPEKEDELLEIIKNSNLHIVGPNIQGIGYIPNHLCAQTTPIIKKEGPLGIITQSGSVTATLAEWSELDGIGITGMVNLGNQIDLCESDFLHFFVEDPNTKAIAMYLEGPQDGKRFFRTLTEVAAQKPVIVIKPGRTKAGYKAAKSHTGSIAENDLIFDTVIKQAGAIRKYQLDEFYDSAKALATQPIPVGNRVFIFTTSGGIASLVVDILNENGAILPSIPSNIIEDLHKSIKIHSVLFDNPYDIPALDALELKDSFELVLAWDIKENLTDLFFFNIADPCPGIENEILTFSTKTRKPIIVSYQGGGKEEIKGLQFLNNHHIPAYPIANRAANSAISLIQYGNIQRKRKKKELQN